MSQLQTPRTLPRTRADAARFIDHTLLDPRASRGDLDHLVKEARAHGMRAVCVPPTWVARVAGRLADSEIEVGTVIGFPLGNQATATKVFEARRALDDGATALDMVMQVGRYLGGEWDAVKDDVAAVAEVAHAAGAHLKVILETGHLDRVGIVGAASLCEEAGADWLKTSTGFGPRGASVSDLRAFRTAVDERLPLKASGGVRDRATMEAMLAAGASRIGTSRGPWILEEYPE